jgi:hypothetical protein
MSLARLQQHQAARSASHDTQHETRAELDAVGTLLVDMYNWFTEGFDTKDLQEAKTLLEELNFERLIHLAIEGLKCLYEPREEGVEATVL